MVIDHIGVVFYPEVYLFRGIGRLSFPLFAWLLVQGEIHTTNIRRYAIRLLVLGLIAEPIYALTFDVFHPNILFTLCIGLICLRGSRLAPFPFQLLVWIGGGLLAGLIQAEYDVYGIGAIALIRYFQPKLVWWAGWIGIHLFLIAAYPEYGEFQAPAMLSPMFFHFTNHQQGSKARWFYLFYPLHLLLLFLLKQGWQPS